jgi:hypothetical protein
VSPSDATLAALLFFQAPGQSPYSTIAVEPCDATCQAEPVCAEPRLYCRAPRHSASRGGWVRYERFDEGVRRYALIADAIAEVAQATTRPMAPACEALPKDERAECERAAREKPWTGGQAELRWLLSTVIAHESTLRRDVHEGTTRGDCDYVDVGGRRVEVEGSCRSHCLGQVMIDPGKRTRRGYRADDLVGLDAAATRRCLETVTDRLSDAHRICSEGKFRSAHMRPSCVLGVYGAVPGWQRDPRIADRAKTYGELRSLRRPLAREVLEALGRCQAGACD